MEKVIGGGDNPRPPSCPDRVAFSVFRYFPFGGLQRDMMRIAEELVSRDIRVVIYCLRWDGPEPPPGITCRQLPARGWSNHRRARNFARALAEELEREKFPVHVAFNRLTPADWHFAADMPFETGVRRSFLEKLMPRYRTFSAMERELFSPDNPTRIMCITYAQKRAYQRIYGTQNERMYILPPGIDRRFDGAWKLREKRDELRAELGIHEDEVLLIQVSSAFHTKGVDRSIAALASLPRELRDRTRMLVVGRGRPSAFAAFAGRCGVGRQVIFAGARDDVAELIAAADLMIHPARNEAAGAVLLESLACGTPVLCSANCGFAPLVREAGNLVLPRRFRQKLLNRTLLVALSTPDKLADLQREAENYGRNGDFYRRAQYAADLITGVEPR